ncbi:hypothetical protein Anas_01914 [Armadillidium nasatum]|uniref:Peptidase S1 domain-containing protein n=1 Tax=Armadillidium nasatum TaxID=96803 RepID=A0A5N5T4H6_9CRUS|nr:hypothetical protein Anas_01914 [Armadillidium nasatum]
MEDRKKNEFYLRKTPVDLRELDVCHENYVNILNDGQNICAEKKEYDKICESSAGTVLQCVGASGQKSIIGLSSWVDSCDKPQKPIVFVNISYHLTWIADTMEKYKSGIPPNGSSSTSPTPPQTSTPTSITSTTSSSVTKCKDKKQVTEQTTKAENEDDNNDEYSYDNGFWGK